MHMIVYVRREGVCQNAARTYPIDINQNAPSGSSASQGWYRDGIC